jgi:hypothetical protein
LPGPRYMPQSVFLVGLASAFCPREQFYTKMLFF